VLSLRSWGWGGRRATAAAGLLAAVSIASLAGCETVAGAGVTGISVDAQARPVIVFALCNDHIDVATIFRDRTKSDPTGQDATVSVATWEAISPVTPATAADAMLNTVKPSRLWSQVGPSESFRPGVVYTAFGGTRDNTWFTGHVDFTLERLSNLNPGQVLTQTYDPDKDQAVDTIQSNEQFTAKACR
jgi:hypothetical protein